MTGACPPELIALAERLVEASGAVIRRHFRTPIAVDQKADLTPVTLADREAEAAIRALLAAERPDDGIIGEEHGAANAERDLVWVIDPIDGTKSFVAGRPIFGTLVALLDRGTPILGVIDQPVIGDRWVGATGHDTRFNGRPARTRACPALSQALLATTTPEQFGPDETVRFLRLSRTAQTAIYGGDCYSYGLVAAGFVDLVVEAGMKLHDFAALAPVVTGAGGMMTDWSGAPLTAASGGQVLATGDPRLHAEALRLLA